MNLLIEQGVRAAQARDAAGALTWFQRAHEKDPQDPVARAWLGQTLCHLGRRIEGLDHLSAAGQRFLDDAGRRTSPAQGLDKVFEVLSQIHAYSGFEQGLQLARDLVRAQPGHARAQYLLAATCGQINLGAEALAAIREADRLAPGDPMVEVLQASLEADARQYEAAYDRLDAVLGRLSASPAQGANARALFRGLKEMARVLDALGEYDGVFPQLEAAARMAPFVPEYAAMRLDVVPELIRRNAAGYTRQGMARFAGDGFAEQPRAPVFVMGFFRSGTTLAQEVLRSHPEVFLSDEVGLLRSMEQELHRMQPGLASVPEKLAHLDRSGIVRLRAAYWRAARGHHGPASERGVFIDKFTLSTVDLGLINTVFPDARVLFVMRDPRDVCLSCVMQLMVPSHATRHLLSLQDTAALYAQVMDWWLQVRDQLSLRHIAFRYEDAVADFETTYRRVFEFIGLDWRDEARNFHERAPGHYVASPSRNQVAQPLYRSSVARWRRYEKEMAPVQKTLAPFVARFGYPAG